MCTLQLDLPSIVIVKVLAFIEGIENSPEQFRPQVVRIGNQSVNAVHNSVAEFKRQF